MVMAKKSTPGWFGVFLSTTTIAIIVGGPVSGELFYFLSFVSLNLMSGFNSI